VSARVAAVGRIEGGDHKATSWPWNLSGVLSAGLLYGLLHAGLRIELSANLPQDDVTANILAQTLEPGRCAAATAAL
jgi:hypothetical protein